jgi:hypothetical protein
VFVHFSETVDNYLLESIAITRLNCPDARIFLISDNEKYIRRINRDLIIFKKYTNPLDNYIQDYYELLYPKRTFERSGFWLKSVKRVYALLDFALSNPNLSLIHLESDSFLVTPFGDLVTYLSQLTQDIYIPIDSENRVIPSLVYIRDSGEVINYIKTINSWFASFIFKDEFFLNDQRIFEELMKIHPGIVGFPDDDPNYLVDPAFVGQYLFGLDARYNNCVLKPGYIRNSADQNILKNSTFLTSLDGNPFNLTIDFDSVIRKRVINLHNHSKENILKIIPNLYSWRSILNQINSGIFTPHLSSRAIKYLLREKITNLLYSKLLGKRKL